MRTPPFLLGVTLLFWGWQTDLLVPSALMGIIVEAARWVKGRWEFSEEDFARIWTFCCLLLLASAVYAFTASQGPGEFLGFFENPNPLTARNIGTASGRGAASFVRWMPMSFFLFVAAQEYSAREGIPIATMTLILSRRWRQARKAPPSKTSGHAVNVSYPYAVLCLVAAGARASEGHTYFWGLCALCAWGLWPQRSRRFSPVVWLGCIVLAITLGYAGQLGINALQGYLNNLNPEWLARWSRRRFDANQSQTELGAIGRLKTSGKIVLRLQSRAGVAPDLLREASYRDYHGVTWIAGTLTNDAEQINPEVPNGNTYVLLRGKTNSSRLQIACYLEEGQGLLPLPTGSGQCDNLVAYLPLQKSSLGAVSVQGPGLEIFDALYGPGSTFDAAPFGNEDLRIPDRERPALQQVVAGLGIQNQDQEKKVDALRRFFLEKFHYSVWQELGRWRSATDTPLSRFLLHTRKGHCEYFATAGVLLLRQLGIPARYAVGWAVHEGSHGKYVVRQRDAHAWCLAWNAQKGVWQNVDFTPPSWVEVENSGASPLQALSDFWSRIKFEIARIRWGQTHLRQYLLWALVPILGLLLYQIVFRRRRKKDGAAQSGPRHVWPGLDSEFYLLERKLQERGFARKPSEALADWLRPLLSEAGLDPLRPDLEQLLRLHYRYRFDPQGLTGSQRETLRRNAAACLAKL